MKRLGSLGRLGSAAVVAALLTGCGVRQSDVVEAGGPATVTVFPDAEQRLLLFFVSAEGRLTPVSMGFFLDGEEKYRVAGDKVLSILLAGPSAEARAAGLHTELPRSTGFVGVKPAPDRVFVSVSIAVRGLEKTAVRQLVCTAAYVDGGDGNAEVIIAGDDGRLPPASCDA